MAVKRARSSKESRGSIIIEAALWLAALCAIFPVVADFFFLTNTYLGVSQITREAVLTHISVPSTALVNGGYTIETLEQQEPAKQEQLNALRQCCTMPKCREYKVGFDNQCAHTVVKWRVRRLLESKGLRIKPENLQITTSQGPDQVIRVEVQADYDALFKFLDGWRIHSNASGGYIGL